MQRSSTRRVMAVIGAAFTAVVSVILAVIPAGAMTVTFVRHAESQANADGIIDTQVPGPDITADGQTQAAMVADILAGQDHDGIYASTMVRTQQTAAPYATKVNKEVTVLDGLQEISAGILEGSSEDEGVGRLGYALAPIAWSLGLRFVRIPGSEDGNEFDARVDSALEEVEADGSDTPVVFSHGATIMFWTMMNVDNPDITLLLDHQLDNTDSVVVEKNEDGGWTLVSWGGEDVGPANLPTQLFVNTRDLIVAPQTALYDFSQEPGVETGVKGVEDAAKATVKFGTDTVADIGNAVRGAVPSAEKPNGATDLTAGNKFAPGHRVTSAISKNNARVEAAVQDVRSEISASIKKVGDTVKKVADAAKDATDGERRDAA